MAEFTFRQVRYFVTVAKSGQISQAAVELNVSQSAVTTAIKNLEDVVGTKLFERAPRGVSLTRAGEDFLSHAQVILARAGEAIQGYRGEDRSIAGRVRVGVTYTVAGYFLMPHLARFKRAFPDIEVRLEEASRRVIERSVGTGALDLALTMMQGSLPSDRFTRHSLLRSPRRIWLASNHPLLECETISLQQVSRQPYIALSVDGAWEFAQSYWDPMPCRPNVVFKTASIEAVRTMVASGMGVTILSDMLYRHWSLEGQRVETRSISESVPDLDVGILTPTWGETAPAAKAFSAFLRRAITFRP